MGRFGTFVSETAFGALVAVLVAMVLIIGFGAEGSIWVIVVSVLIGIPAGNAVSWATTRKSGRSRE
ncbi:hypothetical protein ABZ319_05760 [Nocardia sp. NPDC005978]|uniref:hypothetical protein n=1 Tax=Nocardia sp. NPDC005978 TaxID=3156725 RepID=UPI0033AB9B49